MSHTQVRETQVEVPAVTPSRPSPEATSGNRLSLVRATALVVGSIVGVGIFNLPTSLAG